MIEGVPVVNTVVVAPACVTVTVGVCANTEPARHRTAAERVERMIEDMTKNYRICHTSEPMGVKLDKIIPA